MQQKECMIVRDLLPSYIEQLANGTTVSVIEKHLQECKHCEKVYQELLLQYEQESCKQGKADKRFFRSLRRYRYQMLGGLIGIMIPFVTAAVWLAIVGLKNDLAANATVYTDEIADYGKFEEYQGISELALFPKQGESEAFAATIQKYVYECDKNSLFQECQIYLECQYTEEHYIQEVERLQQIAGQDTGLEVIYTEKDFEYPAIYAMINAESCNEYALLMEEENKIIYVYLQATVDRRELYFDEEYLPLEYGQSGMEFENVEPYSIYPAMYEF